MADCVVESSWGMSHLSSCPLCAAVNGYQLFASMELAHLVCNSLVGREQQYRPHHGTKVVAQGLSQRFWIENVSE